MKDIAAQAGLSAAAVSMALRHHPNIPAATVRRVERLAKALGYRPDPDIARLMAKLRQSRVRGFSGKLALLNFFPSTPLATHNHHLARIARGMRERAAFHGYGIDEFRVGEEGLSPARLDSMLTARGIEGVLLPGSPSYCEQIAFPFERYSAAIIGSSIGLPLHRAGPHQFYDLLTVVRQLTLKGYGAPGLVLRADTDRRVRHQHSAGFLWAQQAHRHWKPVPLLTADEINESLFGRWFARHRPDVVIAQSPSASRYLEWLERLGLEVPAEVGFVSLDIDLSETPVSGIIESKEEYAAAAVDLVVAGLHRGEAGFPMGPKNVLLEGQWREGFTTGPTDPGAARR